MTVGNIITEDSKHGSRECVAYRRLLAKTRYVIVPTKYLESIHRHLPIPTGDHLGIPAIHYGLSASLNTSIITRLSLHIRSIETPCALPTEQHQRQWGATEQKATQSCQHVSTTMAKVRSISYIAYQSEWDCQMSVAIHL